MKLEFTLAGPEAFNGQMDHLADEVAPTGLRSLLRSGEVIMTISKEQFCPVDTGALRSSGNVQGEIRGTEVEVQIGYGGAASEYAVHVHEINRHYNGGKSWKYLQIPLQAGIGDINANLIADYNAMLSGK